jgi:hypothetical protein
MATERLDFSLRLYHAKADLSAISAKLRLKERTGWNIGEERRANEASQRGVRKDSYRSLDLGCEEHADLSDGIASCMEKIASFAPDLHSFIESGGVAALAIGWFIDSNVGGGRIEASAVQELARLGLTLDFYLYAPKEDVERI